ncbi:MAG: sigma-70 family RNA polymerase sigma factor [Phycisphaerae bacterium]|nr:sigma-70 family RNA polymerase sigma factor [Phycisphaerae bacterium]
MTTITARHRTQATTEQPFYAPHPWLRSKAAQSNARKVLAWIAAGMPPAHRPEEGDLFKALHTCAYWASDRRQAQVSASTRRRWRKHWHRVREAVVQLNLGLVYRMLDHFRSPDLDDDDLLSEGMLGLARAVDRFNPWRGFRFSTYACNCIARSCMRRGRRELRYRSLFPVYYDPALDSPAETTSSEVDLRLERLRHVLRINSSDLTELESRVLLGRFPQGNNDRLTFKQIGRSVGLSKERVRQIQNTALAKLRETLEQDPILQ